MGNVVLSHIFSHTHSMILFLFTALDVLLVGIWVVGMWCIHASHTTSDAPPLDRIMYSVALFLLIAYTSILAGLVRGLYQHFFSL